ncbi:MAG: citrate:H+ symporter, partial [Oscillospiraceae bacterium]
MSTLGFLSIAMVVLMMWLLLRGKNAPYVTFVAVPILFAALAGFGYADISAFAVSGISKVANTAVLFIGTILYFGVMGDAGMFDPMINRLVRFADRGVISIFLATSAITMVTHLDGSGVSTYLLTIPVML